jgi:elongator complex protein 1
MKNIRLITEQSVDYGPHLGDGYTIEGIVGHDVTDRMFLCLLRSEMQSSLDGGHASTVEVVSLLNGSIEWRVDVLQCVELDIDALDALSSVSFGLDASAESVCLGLSTGHIVLVDVTTKAVSEVGLIEGGVAMICWSPDGELVVVVGGWGQCLLMTSDWDVLMEGSVFDVVCDKPQPTAMPEEDAVCICGEEGRDPKEWFREKGRHLGSGDVSVSWRGDCKYFATSVRCDPSSPGRVRVWDVEQQVLHALGEQSPGSLPIAAWQPNGRVLCIANFVEDDQIEQVERLRQLRRDTGDQGQAPEVRHVGAWKRELRRRQEASVGMETGPSRVFLYERNGLQHGEFIVPGESIVIEQMEWSADSKTLALVVRDVDEDVVSVQIWCRSNWKWYNKFTRTFKQDKVRRVLCLWHEAPSGTFLVTMTDRGVLCTSRLAWDYDVSEYGSVAVVDGGSILLTPMRQCIIPPPLCAIKVSCGQPISGVFFSRSEDGREMLAALLADGKLALAICDNGDDWESMLVDEREDLDDTHKDLKPSSNVLVPTLLGGAVTGTKGHQLRLAAFLSPTQVGFVGQSSDGIDCLFHYSLQGEEIKFENCVELQSHVSRLVGLSTCSTHRGALIEFEDGSCQLYHEDGRIETAPSFATRCDIVRLANRNCVLGLDISTGRLYRDGEVIALDATSVGCHTKSAGGPHLLYTTRSNHLKTRPLFGGQEDEMVRAIEDGCVIVSLPEQSVDVIMQAPRGNLEIIRPRALVLPATIQALESHEYDKAWSLATVNRLDLNILAAHSWPSLMDNVESFMDGVGSDVDVAGFLQSLEPNDKLEAICKAFRSVAESKRQWLRTELTSHTKCGEIGRALVKVKEVKESDLNNGRDNIVSSGKSMTAEAALKHILLHNPENAVYDAALGEYELQMAYMVVSHSQRDPGEYLAQLQQFAVIENIHLRRATIDRHLGKFDKAVKNLLEAGSEYFQASLELAISKDLLKHLLALVESSTEAEVTKHRSTVLKALGEHLSGRGKYEDAALAFVAGGELEQALRSYRLASAWRPAMTLARRLDKDDEFVNNLARRMAEDLEDSQQPVEAAKLTLEYLGNTPVAIRLFAEGGQWREALRISSNDEEHMEVLVSVASSSATRLLIGFEEDADRVDKYWTRLQELREKRLAMESLESDGKHDELDDDAFLDTASVATDMSMFSMYTDASVATATSTSTFASFASTIGGRRKQTKDKKKKKNKIRRGGPEEENQLARHILTLLPQANICEECGQLAEFLVYIGHEDDAFKLQNSLKILTDKATKAAEDIVSHPPPGRTMELPYHVREGIFNSLGPAALIQVDRAVATVAEPALQVQVETGKSNMRDASWKWEILRR